MEVRLQVEAAAPVLATSGTDHLRVRAAQMRKINHEAQQIKDLVAETAIEWHDRETPEGMHLYALVARRSMEAFRERLNPMPVRVTGPWPATEFFKPRPAKN
jgi:hypothetical protein